MLIQNWLNSLIHIILRLKSLAIAGFFVFACASLTSCDYFSNRVLSQTLVSVGSHKMSTQEFSKSLAAKLKNLDALSAKDPQVIRRFKENIVSDFVVESLMLLWFEEKDLSLPKKDLDAHVKSLIGDYPDDASFRESLSEEGLTYAKWEKKIETGLKRKMIFEQLVKDSPAPSEIELESYYQNNKIRYQQKEAVLLSHILVANENQAEIVKKLTKSQKFADLVKKFSMSSDANFGGQFGWVERDSQADFDRAFKARIGEILHPVKLSDGYHIFKVDEKRSQRVRQYTEVKDQVKSEVLALRETARFSAWLDEQIKRYKVYKNAAVLDSIYVETR